MLANDEFFLACAGIVEHMPAEPRRRISCCSRIRTILNRDPTQPEGEIGAE